MSYVKIIFIINFYSSFLWYNDALGGCETIFYY